MSEWISVKERLPEESTNVLVVHDGGRVTIEWMLSSRKFLYEEIYGYVTHWMPLPEPPEEEGRRRGRW